MIYGTRGVVKLPIQHDAPTLSDLKYMLSIKLHSCCADCVSMVTNSVFFVSIAIV